MGFVNAAFSMTKARTCFDEVLEGGGELVGNAEVEFRAVVCCYWGLGGGGEGWCWWFRVSW